MKVVRTGVTLHGLDGTSPLGYLAALGALESVAADGAAARLGWVEEGGWHPVLTGMDSLDAVAEAILADAHSERVVELLSFRSLKIEKNGPKVVAKFSTSASVVRRWLLDLVDQERLQVANDALGLVCPEAVSSDGGEAPSPDDLREHAIAWDPTTPLAWSAQPTPFDFTSRNAQFLDQIRRVRDVITKEAVIQEVERGVGTPSDRLMRWDPLTDTPYAIYGGAQVQTRPVTEWLAFRGLCSYPLFAEGDRVRMAGMRGRRKEGTFRFGLWRTPLSRAMVRTVVAGGWLGDGERARRERAARGIVAAFEVGLTKDATGYDGAFTPSAPLDAGAG